MLLLLAGLVIAVTPLDRLTAVDVPLMRNLSALFGWLLVVAFLWIFNGRAVLHHRAQILAIGFAAGVGVLELARLLGAEWFGYAGTPSIGRALALYLSWVQPIVLFLVVSMIARHRSAVSWVLAGLPIVSGVLATEAILAGGTERWAPLGLNENFAGLTFGLSVIIAVARILSVHRGNTRQLLLATALAITIPLNIVGVLLSGSRAASAATVVGVLALLVLSRVGSKRLLTLGLAAVLLVVPLWPIYVGAAQTLGDRWERTLALDDFGSRDGLLRVSTELFIEQPLIGYGLTSQRVIGERYFGYPDRPFSAHNTVMSLLVSFGLLGSLLWFAMLVSVFAHVWRHRRAENASLVLASLAMFMTYMPTGSITTNRYFYVMLGLALCTHLWHHQTATHSEDNRNRDKT